ncbi:MAG: fibronectin type III domain-containing protein, partial [Saprospiraceae bacterium]|nr:fibronectin type III domain-containing protein [Saprospiraceae bacterium]
MNIDLYAQTCTGTGSINYQKWNNISGTSISNLTSNSNYPNSPSSSGTRTSFEMNSNAGSNFGIKMYGYLCPPTTGNYVFWIASDDSGELWLSTSSNPAARQRIAYHTGYTNSRQWTKYSTQKSAAVSLVAGQVYYIDALMKEGSGSDNLAVGWSKPGQSTNSPSQVIPGSNLMTQYNPAPDTQAPSAPTNLVVSNLTETSLNLAWSASSDNVGVSGYDVFKNGVKLNSTQITSTSYSVSGLTAGTNYVFFVKANDAAGNSSGNSNTVNPTTLAPVNCAGSGTITYQQWNNIAGTTIASLTSSSNYPNNPSSNGTLTQFETATNTANNYGIKVCGYLCPPYTGAYTFWLASDDNGELWLSTTSNASNKVRIAYHTAWTNSREWSKYTTQKSVSINLVAGQQYYIEALMKEGSGGDNLAVGWAKPGQSTSSPSEVIPGDRLLPLVTVIPDVLPPTSPTNLAVSNLTQSSLTLSWTGSTDNVGVAGYDVYQNGSKINGATIVGTSYNVNGLSAASNYAYYVLAKDAAGNTASSNTLNVTTPDTQAPTAPTNLTVSNLTQTSLTLSWTASTDNVGVVGYDVYQNGVKVNTSTISGNSQNISGLTVSTSYGLYVIAKDAAGNTSTSSTLNVVTPDTQAPSAPTNLAVTNLTQSSLTLSWTASTDNVGVAGYDVYQNGSKINGATIAGTNFNVSGLSAAINYAYYVKAKDAAGNSTNSTTLNVTTPDTQAPTAPTNLAATNLTQTSFMLSWTASTDNVGVIGYDVYQDGIKINGGSVVSTSYNISGLSLNTPYTYLVRAIDAATNMSAASSSLLVTTLAAPDTEAPTAPTNLAVSGLTQSSLTLSWTGSTDNVGVAGYDVYQNGSKINGATIVGTSYNVNGLSAASNYAYYVLAKDVAGNTASSNTLNVTTPDTQAPTAPTNLTVSNLTQTSLTLSWTASTDNVGVVGYDVYQNGVKVNASTISGTSQNISGLTVSTSYALYVIAKDAAGNTSTSSTLNVVTPDTQAPSAPTNLAVTNLTQSSLTLSWTASTDNVGVTGYDVYQNGSKINGATIAGTSYNFSGLSATTNYAYYVKAKDAAGNSTNSSTLNVTTPDTQ